MMRRTFISLLLALLLVNVAAPAAAAPTATKGAEHGAVVKLIESHYGVEHRDIPFVANLANLGVKTAKVVSQNARRVLRFGDFKLAIFEDQDFSGRNAAGSGGIRAGLRRTLEPEWHPLVAARLEEEGQTYTYTKADGDKFKVLVVVIGERDATVLQVNLNLEEFAKLLLNPEQESRELTNEATSVEQE